MPASFLTKIFHTGVILWRSVQLKLSNRHLIVDTSNSDAMGILNKLFQSKASKKKAACSICKSVMNHNDGFALSTAEVIASKKYWDRKMVEPDTLSYTTSHFKNQDQSATNMRKIIFEKTSEKDSVWMTCESCIDQFEVCLDESKALAREWWELGADFEWRKKSTAKDALSEEEFEEIKSYATMEAGSAFVKV